MPVSSSDWSDTAQAADEAEQWRALGASQVSINTMGSEDSSLDAHVRLLELVAAAVSVN